LAEPWQLLAVHGWGSDQRCWDPWRPLCEQRGWGLQCHERGYGRFPAASPGWAARGRRALVVHSMGLHLVPPGPLASAEAILLLASFGSFLPPGPAGRSLALALRAMAARLERGEVQELFEDFRVQVAAPQSVENLPAGVEDGPVAAIGRQRLIEDLALLSQCTGLPKAFPKGAAVLIVEAEADAIVHPLSRQALRTALPQASLRSLPGIGHSLLVPALAEQLLDWLRQQ